MGDTNGLTSSSDRGIILSNAADGVDESNENSIRREHKTTSVDKQPLRKFTKPAARQTTEPLKKKLRRKKKKERRLKRIKLRKLRQRFKSLGFVQVSNQLTRSLIKKTDLKRKLKLKLQTNNKVRK